MNLLIALLFLAPIPDTHASEWVDLETRCGVWIYDYYGGFKTGCAVLETTHPDPGGSCRTICTYPLYNEATNQRTGCQQWDTVCTKLVSCHTRCETPLFSPETGEKTGCKEFQTACLRPKAI